MCTVNNFSVMKETLKNLCCCNGWSYGIFWGFHDTNPLLLTLKDAYYEEQMGALIENMLLQVHVLGDGVIGQVAFTKDHQWMYNDHNHNYLVSFESLEDDSELYYQFSLGIKTIALISVEPWGVVQFGSTHKIIESTNFVDQVKQLFQNMDKHQGTSDNQFLEDFIEANDSLVFPEFGDFFDCSFSNNSDCSVLTFGLNENMPFSRPSNGELSEDIMNTQKSTPLLDTIDCFTQKSTLLLDPIDCFTQKSTPSLDPNDCFTQKSTPLLDPNDCKAQNPCGLLTLDDLFQENDFVEPISRTGLMDNDELSQCFSITSNDVSHVTGLIPLSNLSGYNSPIHKCDNIPTNSLQSSLSDAFVSNREMKCSSLGVETGLKKQSWNETLIPFSNGDELSYSTNDVGSKVGTSKSLFSKLGLDHILDGSASSTSSFSKSKFDEQFSSSSCKRRKIDSNAWSQNEVKIQDRPTFYGNNSQPCIQDSSKRQEENAKSGKKKAKMGTKPRPKDRQMIQDRLAELRELIPNGEKMSIDRLLERTIKHLNFMHCLTIRAETLKQLDKQKSCGTQKDHSSDSGGGVTWACELGDQTMVCPLIVEDLSTHGQMLIEMVSEEEGFFLEIVDIIRGFGLTILKGVMEDRETKIWAHFIVESEGTHRVTRHEVFSSLIQLLQMTGQSTTNANDSYSTVMSSGVRLFDSYPPVDLADTLQCANFRRGF